MLGAFHPTIIIQNDLTTYRIYLCNKETTQQNTRIEEIYVVQSGMVGG